jgi:hypothetical protein
VKLPLAVRDCYAVSMRFGWLGLVCALSACTSSSPASEVTPNRELDPVDELDLARRPMPAPSPEPPKQREPSKLEQIADRYALPDDACLPDGPPNPFTELDYDRVVAYGYPEPRLAGDTPRSVRVDSGRLMLGGPELVQAELSREQIDAALATLGDPATYGGRNAPCFEPHHSLVFYAGEEIVGFVDICFECNVLESTPVLRAQHAHNRVEDDLCITRRGFSAQGWRQLRRLCASWGVGRCPTASSWSLSDSPAAE